MKPMSIFGCLAIMRGRRDEIISRMNKVPIKLAPHTLKHHPIISNIGPNMFGFHGLIINRGYTSAKLGDKVPY